MQHYLSQCKGTMHGDGGFDTAKTYHRGIDVHHQEHAYKVEESGGDADYLCTPALL